MYWRLLPGLNACIASDRVILLDVERDRYSALSAEIGAPTIAWLHARDGSTPPAKLVALVREAFGEQRIRPGIDNRAQIDVEVDETFPVRHNAAAGLMTVASVTLAVTSTWLALRTRKLRSILRGRERVRDTGPRIELPALQARAAAFSSARRWCPIAPNCLLDSLAFDRWIGGPGNARLVFGVVGHPFEAHCWVQAEGVVLNDSYDRVSRFEVILSQ